MRYALLIAVLVSIACGGPSTPTVPPTPAPIIYPNMLGGWSGTQADTWVSVDGTRPGGRSCNEAWLVTSQVDSFFSGSFQRTQGNSDVCARSGNIEGRAEASGIFSVSYSATGVAGGCQLIGGDQVRRGVVSPNGNVTAGTVLILRCPDGRGTIDLRYTTSVTVSRR